MRYYGFVNYYLSPIAHGIQTTHCVVEIQQKVYQEAEPRPKKINFDCSKKEQYDDWARNHKTVMLLNGGNQESLKTLIQFFNQSDNPFAWSYFREDEQSLNNCITTVGIILPERIYTFDDITSNYDDYTDYEIELARRLKTYRLA